MPDDIKPGKSVKPQAATKPSFTPAKNPFENQSPQPITNTATQPAPEKKRSAFSLSLGKKKEAEKPQVQTPTTVAGKATTMVGETTGQQVSTPEPAVPEEMLFRWQAPEFAYTNKPAGWFIGLGVFTLALIGLAIWTHQWVTIVLIALMGIAAGVWANRKPKVLEYKISNYGVYVNNHKYLFDSFKEFYEFKDYNQPTLDLVPAKRFGTLVSMPLATDDADEIVDTIGQMVPKTEHSEDALDRLVRKLRF